jgi:molybdopterin molybdotransferase
MISVQTATQIFKAKLTINAQRTAFPIYADRSYPPFDRVMMDGIAVNYDEFSQGRRVFQIAGVAPAGEAQKILSDKVFCLEVMTGAPLPNGTNLVIPFEHLKIESGIATIVKDLSRERFENIHAAGSDCLEGELVLKAGSALNGPHQGIASSMGVKLLTSVTPRVMIISTGDELIDVEQTPLAHQIRRSNVHALKYSLELNGFSDVFIDHLNDDPEAIALHYQKYAHDFDLMIYSGGVSKGKFDYLPNVWVEMGVTKHFHEVAQRPGKPLWFGTDEKNHTTVLGLPGNPVSSLVCLHRYLIPGREIFVRLSEEVVFKKDLTYFLPVVLESHSDGSLWAKPLKIKNSGEFTALADSDGFIELPADSSVFKIGEAFSFYSWRHF